MHLSGALAPPSCLEQLFPAQRASPGWTLSPLPRQLYYVCRNIQDCRLLTCVVLCGPAILLGSSFGSEGVGEHLRS